MLIRAARLPPLTHPPSLFRLHLPSLGQRVKDGSQVQKTVREEGYAHPHVGAGRCREDQYLSLHFMGWGGVE